MQLSLRSSRINQFILGVLLVLFSFTEIPVMQIEKAIITPFHFAIILFSIPVIWFKPGIIRFNKYLGWLLLYILLINLAHLSSVRITSVLYTLIFVYEFIVIGSLLKFVQPAELKRIFLFILLLYFINVLITFLLINFGLYTDELGFIFRAYVGVRPMGFSSEPSYAAFIITVAFLCYNELKYATVGKNSFWALLMFIVTIVLTTSAYGLIYVALCIAFITFRRVLRMPFKYRLIFFGTVSFIAVATVVYLSTLESEPIQRVFNIVTTMISDKPLVDKLETIGEVDVSAWTRIGPTWMLFQDNSIDAGLLFGHGAGSSSSFFQDQMAGIITDADRMFLELGIIPSYIYDFGLVGFFLLLYVIYQLARKNKIFFILVITFFFNAGINTQIFWYTLTAIAVTTTIIRDLKLSNEQQADQLVTG